MSVPGAERHASDQDGSDQGPDDRDKFQKTGDYTQHCGVGCAQ